MDDGPVAALLTFVVIVCLLFAAAVGGGMSEKSMCNDIRLRIGVDAYQAAVKAEICK